MPPSVTAGSGEGLAAAVAANPLWYHTLELGPGVVTPGWFDLRPIVDRMPWPDVRGKNCLDIGTYDGFLAFELEKRGAARVTAVDISDHELWDWPADIRAKGPAYLASVAGEKGHGFSIAREALGSNVEKVECSVYDLDADGLGKFDVVVMGSLLLHLRDPIRALEAIRGMCDRWFLSADGIDPGMTLRLPRAPAFRLVGKDVQWWLPNRAGYHRMIELAGFSIEQRTRPYAIPLGAGHPYRRHIGGQRGIATRIVCRGSGNPHAAVLARPAVP